MNVCMIILSLAVVIIAESAYLHLNALVVPLYEGPQPVYKEHYCLSPRLLFCKMQEVFLYWCACVPVGM